MQTTASKQGEAVMLPSSQAGIKGDVHTRGVQSEPHLSLDLGISRLQPGYFECAYSQAIQRGEYKGQSRGNQAMIERE